LTAELRVDGILLLALGGAAVELLVGEQVRHHSKLECLGLTGGFGLCGV
jgi:hypothetical protein